MTHDAATLRDVAIALGVDPSGDVLTVARQAAAAAREVDTALLVLAAVDEPAEPLVAAVRRLLRERDEARRERDEARRDVEHIHAESVRRGNVLHNVREALAGGPEGDGDRTLAERAARIVRERDEARADEDRLRAAIRAAVPAIRAGLDAGGDHALYRERIAAGDALRALADAGEGGEAPAALSAAELEVVRGVLRVVDHDVCIRSGTSRSLVRAWGVWRDAGRPLAGEESEG